MGSSATKVEDEAVLEETDWNQQLLVTSNVFDRPTRTQSTNTLRKRSRRERSKSPFIPKDREMTGEHRVVVKVPVNLRGKVIGKGGDTIRDIESDYPGVKITMPPRDSDSEDVVLTGPADAVNRAKMRIMDICGTGPKVTEEARAKAQKLHREVDDLYEQMRRANTKQEKDALRKKAEAKKEQANAADTAAAKEIFKVKNSGYFDDQMDLHGLYVKEAMEFVRERLNKCDARLRRGEMTLTIITGAGHHSDHGQAKIKPEVEAYLKQKGYPFTTETDGAYVVSFPSGGATPTRPPAKAEKKPAAAEEEGFFAACFRSCFSWCCSDSKTTESTANTAGRAPATVEMPTRA